MMANICAEIIRYSFYFLDFFFGVLFWGIVANRFKNFTGFDKFGFDLKKNQTTCGIFNVKLDDNDKITSAGSSATCDAIIVMSAVMMVLLFIIVIWHSLIFFNKDPMPYALETVTLGTMSGLWFILAIIALTRSPAPIRNVITALRAAIASGFLAGFSHSASAIIAFFVGRRGRDV